MNSWIVQLVSLTEEKTDLLSLWERRKKEFDQCYELQLFLWDVEQLENWIATQKVNNFFLQESCL